MNMNASLFLETRYWNRGREFSMKDYALYVTTSANRIKGHQ